VTAGLFFTGTDTGVGKTYVTAAVAGILRRQGRAFRIRKPVATGAAWAGGRWLGDDTWRLAEAAGEPDPGRVTAYAFPEPAAPPVAARAAGVTLTLGMLADAAAGNLEPGAALLVEGVGGLLCPLTERDTVADLAAALGLPLVVVARRALGTLNHTLLTLEAARARGLPVCGVVVSETTRPEGLAEATNVDELRRRAGVPVIAVAPHRPGGGEVPELAAVDWWALAGGKAARGPDRGATWKR
jgi:dethiobiotin synthetase